MSSSSAADNPSKLSDASAPRAFRPSTSDRNRVGIDTSRQARQEYSQRFRELQEEFRKTREKDDLGKIESLELEMEELTSAVAKATGLGGRSRQKTDIEKIRKSVREAISRDMRRIGKTHKALGNHLTTFIDTGLTCRYFPDPLAEWVT